MWVLRKGPLLFIVPFSLLKAVIFPPRRISKSAREMSGVRSVLILSWVFLLFSFCSAHEGKPEVCPFSAGSIHHHDHDHHHDGCNHDHNSHPQVRKLPEELAEEEDLAMEDLEKRNFRHHHNHGISEFSTLGKAVQKTKKIFFSYREDLIS